VFLGFTPTFPVQTVMVSAVALFFRQNLTAALLGAWVIPNPFVIFPFYVAEYRIGKYILGMDASLTMSDFTIMNLLNLGWHIALPLLVGWLVVATIFTIPSYFLALKLIVYNRRKKEHRAGRS
jgi:uncharacterized protein (DUF2062 family)